MGRKQKETDQVRSSVKDIPEESPAELPPGTPCIQLLHDYGGRRTNERRIAPGVYTTDDPALFGLADYLVESGHAVRVE